MLSGNSPTDFIQPENQNSNFVYDPFAPSTPNNFEWTQFDPNDHADTSISLLNNNQENSHEEPVTGIKRSRDKLDSVSKDEEQSETNLSSSPPSRSSSHSQTLELLDLDKKARNKISAANYRKRRKNHLTDLEETNARLVAEVDKITEEKEELLTKNVMLEADLLQLRIQIRQLNEQLATQASASANNGLSFSIQRYVNYRSTISLNNSPGFHSNSHSNMSSLEEEASEEKTNSIGIHVVI